MNIRRPYKEKENASLAVVAHLQYLALHIKHFSVYFKKIQSHSQQNIIFHSSTVDNLCSKLS